MAFPDSPPVLLGNRYQILDQLGAGAMGLIYRAHDRLTGQDIALKRVIVGSNAYSNDDLRLALLREFRMLASLRHPNIISVLDYGFDPLRQPFYTMKLIHGAQDVVSYARSQSIEVKIRLISQLLQALAYLHRRGVLHRDLKPMNVLVDGDETVRLVDFGLAVITESSTKSLDDLTAGTLAYMAPELFKGDRVSQQADLYAVGVMAYEIFAGKHPFNANNVGALISDVIHRQPDLSLLPEPARPWLSKLLAKTRAERQAMGSAAEINRRLFEAFGLPIPVDPVAVRESFLQSATFVGREPEMTRLSEALSDAVRGRGSAWLIGGESGVGKSRLVSELRTLALVSGALVASAQAVTELSGPYQFWSEALRRLCLMVDPDQLSDAAAGVLHTLIPDAGALLRREITPVSPVNGDPEVIKSRLLETVIDLLRLAGLSVLLLEDLQWASAESLALLAGVSKLASSMNVLIIGTYRDDETPDLPEQFPDMQLIKLERLDKHGITDLCVSILGSQARETQVIDFLERETEGNAFFVVEVIRTLGEEVSSLDQIGGATLPHSVFSGGVKQIVYRRLNRLPESAQPMLQLAAVLGRQIDPAVMRLAAPDTDLDAWFAVCADAAVLEAQEGLWRFAHDKLREGVLHQIENEQFPVLHHKAALALEQCYQESGAPPEQAALLAFHWGAAGDTDRERQYLALACQHALQTGAYRQAQQFGEQAMALVAEVRRTHSITESESLIERKWLARLHAALGGAYSGTGNYTDSRHHFESQLALNRDSDDLDGIANALGNLSQTAWRVGNYQEAWQYASDSELIFRKLGDAVGIAWALGTLSSVARWLGDNEIAQRHALEALTIYTELGNPYGIAESHNNLGLVAQMLGDFSMALKHFQESLKIGREIGTPDRNLHQTLNNLGIVAATLGKYDQARAYFEESLALAIANGNQRLVANLHSNLGSIALQMRRYVEARQRLDEALRIAREIGHRRIIAWALSNLGALTLTLGVFPEAEAYYQESLDTALELGERYLIAYALNGLGDVARLRDNHDEAWARYREALSMMTEIKAKPSALAMMAGIARLLAVESRAPRAAALIGMVLKQPALNAEGRAAAESVVIDLGLILGDQELADQMKQGESLDFDQVVQELVRFSTN
ncbi:MAG: tetratricopeptide repeat protein [Anaerolineae bacterium]